MKMRGPESFNLRRFVLFFPREDDPVEGVVGSRQPVHVWELLDGFQLHLQLQWQEDSRYGVAILWWYQILASTIHTIRWGFQSEIQNMRLDLRTAVCLPTAERCYSGRELKSWEPKSPGSGPIVQPGCFPLLRSHWPPPHSRQLHKTKASAQLHFCPNIRSIKI